jgi:5,10-methylenetetrahydrofolate reductase
MHLTCTNMPVEKLDSALEEVRLDFWAVATHRNTKLEATSAQPAPAQPVQLACMQVRKAGLQNILALRGDPPKVGWSIETRQHG